MSQKGTEVPFSRQPSPIPAIVLIDPVSSGKHLKPYIHFLGYKLVAVFTLTREQLIASGKDIPPEEKYRFCDNVLETNQQDQIETWLKSLPYRIEAIIAASEPAVELADTLAKAFGVIGNDPCTSVLRRNKFEARAAVQKAGLPGPDFLKCTSTDDLLGFLDKHPFPVVLKTPEGAGAHHVFVCHDTTQALQAHQSILTQPNLFGKNAPYSLVEEYIHGPQFVVELFAADGQIHLTSLWEFEFGAPTNGRIEFERARLIVDQERLESLNPLISYATSVAKALDLRWGPCLVELRNSPTRGPQLIELGARLSGIELPVMLREASHFDPFLETLNVFLGKSSIQNFPVIFKKGATLVFVRAQGEGIVESILGMNEIQELQSYFMSLLTIQIGSRVSPSRDLASIPLYTYLLNENNNTLEEDESKVREYFRLVLKQPSKDSRRWTSPII